MLHGFPEVSWNGETIYGHGGNTVWFHSFTAMLPVRNRGVFIAYNTDTGAPAVQQFFATLFDHYFPPAKNSAIGPIVLTVVLDNNQLKLTATLATLRMSLV